MKLIKNLSTESVKGNEVKGGGAPGYVDSTQFIEAGWLEPNDPDYVVQSDNSSENSVVGIVSDDANIPLQSELNSDFMTPVIPYKLFK